VQSSWLPLRDQWAECRISQHLNYGQGVTSQTESSNSSIKSYVVTGKSDFLRLAKALKEMCLNHEKAYLHKVAQQHQRIKLVYYNQGYLGDLPSAVSRLALDLIAEEKR